MHPARANDRSPSLDLLGRAAATAAHPWHSLLLLLAAGASVLSVIWNGVQLWNGIQTMSGTDHARVGLIASICAAALVLGAMFSRGKGSDPEPEPEPDPAPTPAVATVTFDPSLRILTIDSEAARLFGYQAQEIAGKSLSLILPNVTRRDVSKWSAKTENTRMRSSARGRDGVVFPVEVEARATGDGRFLALIRAAASSATPVAEQSLPWRDFFLAAPNPMLIVDSNGAIVRANRAFEELFEYASAELQRASYWDAFLSGQQAEEAAAEFYDHTSSPRPPDLEQVWITRTGNPIPVRWSRASISNPGSDPGSRTTHILLSGNVNNSARDATRHMAARFAQGFRNHLTIVCGYSDLLLSNTPASHPNRNDIEQIRRAAAAASLLADDLARQAK